MTDPPPIARVILHYFPDWEPPAHFAVGWRMCLCPFHDESHPSAGISYEHDAFRCHSCPMRGDAVGLIRKHEGVSYESAVERAKEILGREYVALPRGAARKSGRRVPGKSGARRSFGGGPAGEVPGRVRRRPFAGS